MSTDELIRYKSCVMKQEKPSRVRITVTKGHKELILTTNEYCESIEAFGRSIQNDKASSVAFLQKAGILDKSGQLAEPFCS